MAGGEALAAECSSSNHKRLVNITLLFSCCFLSSSLSSFILVIVGGAGESSGSSPWQSVPSQQEPVPVGELLAALLGMCSI